MIRWKVTNLSRASVIVHNVSNYSRFYYKGTIVKAKSGTLGLMTFKTKLDALDFAKEIFHLRGFKILKVQSIGRGRVPDRIALKSSEESLNFFYSEGPLIDSWLPPEGTICYDKIKVLT